MKQGVSGRRCSVRKVPYDMDHIALDYHPTGFNYRPVKMKPLLRMQTLPAPHRADPQTKCHLNTLRMPQGYPVVLLLFLGFLSKLELRIKLK
eukprot:5571043-Amphidinium_carterae.1